MRAKSNAVLHIGLFRRDANGVFVPVAIGHARSRSWGRWSSDAATSFRRKRSWAPAGPGLWWRRGICSFRPRRFARSSAPRNRGRVAPRQKSGGLSICRAGDPARGRSSKRSARSRQFWQTWCRILQPLRHIRCTGPKCDRRRAGARRLSITKEWCYGPRNAPPASGHCPYSRPAPKPNRRGRPPVSARIARRLDDLLERVALLPIGEPPRPQVRPADKPYSIAFLCSYACGTNSLSRIYVRASTVI